ncbi:hypothetical protein Tco_1384266 [Tanacetum coccineum]
MLDPRLGTRGSNDIGGARTMVLILLFYKDTNLPIKDQVPAFLIRQKGEKESKALELCITPVLVKPSQRPLCVNASFPAMGYALLTMQST